MNPNRYSYLNGLQALMITTDSRINAVRQVLGIRPDIAAAEKRAHEALNSLEGIARVSVAIETQTGQAVDPCVLDFLKDRVRIVEELAGELMMCKLIFAAGEARKRNPATEN